MARVLITGSSDGPRLMAAKVLACIGHAVTLHARIDQRASTPIGRSQRLSTSSWTTWPVSRGHARSANRNS